MEHGRGLSLVLDAESGLSAISLGCQLICYMYCRLTLSFFSKLGTHLLVAALRLNQVQIGQRCDNGFAIVKGLG